MSLMVIIFAVTSVQRQPPDDRVDWGVRLLLVAGLLLALATVVSQSLQGNGHA